MLFRLILNKGFNGEKNVSGLRGDVLIFRLKLLPLPSPLYFFPKTGH